MSEKRQDLISGLILPMGQAILTGLLFALLAVSCWKLSRSVTGWTVFFTALSGAAFLAWLTIWRKWQSWGDSDHGLTPTQPEIVYPTESIRVELHTGEPEYPSVEFLEVSLTREQIIKACKYLVKHDYQTSGLGGKSKPLSRSESDVLRDALIAREWAFWRNPGGHTRGWELAPAGRAVCRYIAGIDSSPPPAPGFRAGNQDFTGSLHTYKNKKTGGERIT